MVLVPIGSGTTTSASDAKHDSQSAVGEAWKAALEKAQSERSSSSLNPTTIAGAPGGDVILPPPGLGPYAPPDFGPIIFGPDVRQPPLPEYGPDVRQPPSPEYGPDVRQPPSPEYGPDVRQPPSPEYGPDVRQPPGTFGPPGTEPTPPSTEPTPLWVNYVKGKAESGETGQTGETGKAGKAGKTGVAGPYVVPDGNGGYRIDKKALEKDFPPDDVKKIQGQPEAQNEEEAEREVEAAMGVASYKDVKTVYLGKAADEFLNGRSGREPSPDVIGVTTDGDYRLAEAKGEDTPSAIRQFQFASDKLPKRGGSILSLDLYTNKLGNGYSVDGRHQLMYNNPDHPNRLPVVVRVGDEPKVGNRPNEMPVKPNQRPITVHITKSASSE
jgi:hypothetical protein